MGYKVIFSPQAIQRLEQIVCFIAQNNPEAAQRFGNRLLDRAELLSNFPELGVTYHNCPGVRRLSCKPYLIYYRVNDAQQVVEVLDFWHSARQDPDL